MLPFDLVTNTIASDYIEKNRFSLISTAHRNWLMKLGVDVSLAEDLVSDVYESMLKKERNGKPFSPNASKYGDIDVSTYIYATMKKYALNSKYQGKVYSTKTDKYGEKEQIQINFVSPIEDAELSSLSGDTKGYMIANSTQYDEMLLVEENMLDLQDEYDYVIHFTNKVNVKHILANYQTILSGKLDTAILEPLREIIKQNDEFAESFTRIIKLISTDIVAFNKLVQAC